MYPFTSFAYRPIHEASEQLLRVEGPGSWYIALVSLQIKLKVTAVVLCVPAGSGNDPVKVPQLVGSRSGTTIACWRLVRLYRAPLAAPDTLCVQLFNFFLIVFVHFCHSFLKAKVKSLSRVWLFGTPWAVDRQAPLSMGFSRQDYWSGLPCPSPGDLLTQELNPGLPHCRQTLYHLSHQGSYSYTSH